MSKLLTAGVKEIQKLPVELQDSVGMDLIDRAVAWHDLREKIMEGIREADAGLGRRVSAKELIKEFRKRHGKQKK